MASSVLLPIAARTACNMPASEGWPESSSHWPGGAVSAIDTCPTLASLAELGRLRSEASRKATAGRIDMGAPCPGMRSRLGCVMHRGASRGQLQGWQHRLELLPTRLEEGRQLQAL